jgi:hypothetical protein
VQVGIAKQHTIGEGFSGMGRVFRAGHGRNRAYGKQQTGQRLLNVHFAKYLLLF